jgi:type I restriction enzyme S subunit
VSDSAIAQTSTNVIERGQLFLVTRTGVGKLAIAPCDIAISQDIMGVYLDEEKADTRFLFHRMRQGVEDLKKLNQGTSINGIIRSDLVAYPLELPPLATQRRIAEILSTVDEAIEQTEALIAKYQQIKAGLMHDLFTCGLTPEGHLRPTYAQAPHLYRESPIGWIPKESEVVPLSSVTQFITSGSRGWAKYYSEVGPLFIRIGNLTREHINFRWDNVTRVSLPKFTEGQRTAVLPNDILISITADLGIVAVAGDALGEAYVNQHIALVRPKVEPEVSRFLGHFLSTVHVQKQFLRLNDSGAKAGLNLPAIGKILIVIPAQGMAFQCGSIRPSCYPYSTRRRRSTACSRFAGVARDAGLDGNRPGTWADSIRPCNQLAREFP